MTRNTLTFSLCHCSYYMNITVLPTSMSIFIDLYVTGLGKVLQNIATYLEMHTTEKCGVIKCTAGD